MSSFLLLFSSDHYAVGENEMGYTSTHYRALMLCVWYIITNAINHALTAAVITLCCLYELQELKKKKDVYQTCLSLIINSD